jgi:23S rRNA (adenine2503-C2)-methyltransferase
MTAEVQATPQAASETAVDLLDLDRGGLEAFFAQELGEKPFRGRQVLKWLHGRGVSDFDAMTDLSKSLRAKLHERARVFEPRILSEQRSSDGTLKWLLELEDGNAVETVFIPEADRGTLCVSAQVGCPLDCSFCATGQAGFTRNLRTGEIAAQVRLARSVVGEERLTNLVFMGMGEPLLNFDAVQRAINLLLDDDAYNLSRRRITVSTAGLVPAMERLAAETPVNLAVSLHATRDSIRDELVPLNRKHPLERLMAACRGYPLPKGRRITFEYVMIDGVNDAPEHARELVDLLRGIPSKVNLIPFNPFPGAPYRRSSDAAIERFRDILHEASLTTVTRTPRGEDIDAACGQLQGRFEARRRRQ